MWRKATTTEAEVWYGIKESGIGRSEVFIISKVSPDAVRSGKVRESLDRTIEAFGGTYVDLMLIHWPVARKVKERWRIMEKYVDVGKIRAIGVSNFNPHHVDELLAYARIKPVVNQTRFIPTWNIRRSWATLLPKVFKFSDGPVGTE